MQHDIKNGLVHFDDYELGVIGEKRSPIDYRAMLAVAPQVRLLADACAYELAQLTIDPQDDTVIHRPEAIQKLRKRAEDLESLAIGTRIIAENVEFEIFRITN